MRRAYVRPKRGTASAMPAPAVDPPSTAVTSVSPCRRRSRSGVRRCASPNRARRCRPAYAKPHAERPPRRLIVRGDRLKRGVDRARVDRRVRTVWLQARPRVVHNDARDRGLALTDVVDRVVRRLVHIVGANLPQIDQSVQRQLPRSRPRSRRCRRRRRRLAGARVRDDGRLGPKPGRRDRATAAARRDTRQYAEYEKALPRKHRCGVSRSRAGSPRA